MGIDLPYGDVYFELQEEYTFSITLLQRIDFLQFTSPENTLLIGICFAPCFLNF